MIGARVRQLRLSVTARLRRLLAERGVEVSRTGGVRRTPALVLAHARGLGFEPATVIDVGVAWGTYELYETFPQARHLLIEPMAEYTEALELIARRYRAEYVLAAAGPEPGTTHLNVHRAPALSSTLGRWRGESGGEPRRVPVVRVDDLVAERDLPGPYLLKVDVEGGELGVLDGARTVLSETELALLEVSFFEFLPGMPLLHEVIAYMHARGFVPYDLYGGHVRPLDAALAMVNLAFVKEGGPLRRDHRFATPAQADEMVTRWGF